MEIKPCPFCGGEVSPYKTAGKYYLQCFSDNCEVNLSIDRPHDTEESIIAAWNRRNDKIIEPLDAN